MENANKTGIKKYIKLEDGRVLESSKCKIVTDIQDDTTSTTNYYVEIHEEGYTNYTKIVAESNTLMNGNYTSYPDLDLEFVLKQTCDYRIKKVSYDTSFDGFYPETGYLEDGEGNCHLINTDEELYLGSWYEGGMRFVAKWDREKKDWVLI